MGEKKSLAKAGLAAGDVRIDGNASMKVAALAVSSAGVLSVTEMV